MDELLALVLLLREGMVAKDEYYQRLDELFLESSQDDDLLYLECETDIKCAIIYIMSHVNYDKLDYEKFGKALMSKVKVFYRKCSDIERFANRMYSLWEGIPGSIQDKEPFSILAYADEPLSWGDKEQTKTIYEEMLNYYD